MLLALDSASATLAKPYLGVVPAYASGLVFEPRDDGRRARPRRHPVVPKFPGSSRRTRRSSPRCRAREFPSAALTRLYALGLDAFAWRSAFRNGPPEQFSLEGATGEVTLRRPAVPARRGVGVFKRRAARPSGWPALNPNRNTRATPRSGARAEALAAEFLAARGLVLLDRNFRARRGEIDLVMRDGASLVFVEVRLRTNRHFGGAAASITAAKRQRLGRAAQAYLARLGREPPPCRFDAVLLDALAAAPHHLGARHRSTECRCTLLESRHDDRLRKPHPRAFRRQRPAQARRRSTSWRRKSRAAPR